MMKRYLSWAAIASVFLLGFNACILDPKSGGGDPPPPTPYGSLKEKDHVLFNLRKAYNERNLQQYDRLLNVDFTFQYPLKDDTGTIVDRTWGRDSEIELTDRIFNADKAQLAGKTPVSSIDLDLDYPQGDGSWIMVTPADTIKYRGEVWYRKTAEYFLTLKAGATTYQSNTKTQALFEIRHAVVKSDTIWQIVNWVDDINNFGN